MRTGRTASTPTAGHIQREFPHIMGRSRVKDGARVGDVSWPCSFKAKTDGYWVHNLFHHPDIYIFLLKKRLKKWQLRIVTQASQKFVSRNFSQQQDSVIYREIWVQPRSSYISTDIVPKSALSIQCYFNLQQIKLKLTSTFYANRLIATIFSQREMFGRAETGTFFEIICTAVFSWTGRKWKHAKTAVV